MFLTDPGVFKWVASTVLEVWMKKIANDVSLRMLSIYDHLTNSISLFIFLSATHCLLFFSRKKISIQLFSIPSYWIYSWTQEFKLENSRSSCIIESLILGPRKREPRLSASLSPRPHTCNRGATILRGGEIANNRHPGVLNPPLPTVGFEGLKLD